MFGRHKESHEMASVTPIHRPGNLSYEQLEHLREQAAYGELMAEEMEAEAKRYREMRNYALRALGMIAVDSTID